MENLRGAAEQNRSSRPLARQRHGDEGGGKEGEVTLKVGVNREGSGGDQRNPDSVTVKLTR